MKRPHTAESRPRTSERWPRLSQTLPHLHPLKCAECGRPERDRLLTLWQECDEQDRPENRYVLLCKPCGDRIVGPHVRLYRSIDRNSPAPGAMEICADCRFRDGLWCARAKCNGGEGVTITAAQPLRGFIDGRDYSGPFTSYATPPSACTAKLAH